MSLDKTPASWSDLELAHLLYAYRKAKVDCFYERSILAAEQFTSYESNLFGNLSRLHTRLRANEIDGLLNENLGQTVVVAKKLSKKQKSESNLDGHDFFSDPERFFQRFRQTHCLTPEFRVVGHFSVEMHLLSALWVNLVGHRFDKRLSSNVFGSRLRRYRPRPGSVSEEKGEFHREALGSFEPYFTPYKTWRAKGLTAIRSELEAERSIVAISLDLANYYHRIDPHFIAQPGFQKAIGVELDSWGKSFTSSIVVALSAWAEKAKDKLKSYGAKPGASETGGLPLGLSTARLMANVLLYQLDDGIVRGLTPIYYGRYVDDMFLVIHDPGDLANARALFKWIHARVPLLRPEKDEQMRVAFKKAYAAESVITLQREKQKVFFLAGSVGLDLLSSIESEIREVSSERRLLPDPQALEEMASAKVLTAAESPAEGVDTLRRANGLSVRRLGWSILLRCVETLARDLHAADWYKERTRFYDFARAHILRPDRVLDHADYLPRLLALAVALDDWAEARELWLACSSSIDELQNATAKSRKQGKQRCTLILNGHVSKTSSSQVWNDLKEHLRDICGDAVLRSLRWRRSSEPEPLGPTARALLIDLNHASTADFVTQTALNLREADWAKMAYKDHIRRSAAKPKTPQAQENELLKLYPRAEDIKDFIGASAAVDRNCLSAVRTRFACPDGKSAEAFESMLPYLFPTRPYTAQEIALFVPSCIKSTATDQQGDWARYVRALRGSWVTERPDYGPAPQSAQQETGEQALRIWKIGRADRPGRITLGITSLLTEEDSWRRSAANSPDLSPARYRRLAQLIKQAVRASPRPTHLILPELALPERWIPSVSGRLSDVGISLVAGLEYHHQPEMKIHSDAVLILSDDRLGYPSWVEIRQPKSEPAPHEEEALLHDFGKTWAYDRQDKAVYNHGGFHFGVLVCSELQNIGHRQRFQGAVDCMMVLAWNQDLETFSALVESAALDVHAYIAMANNRKYGDSRVRAPAKDSFSRDICRLRGGENDYLVVIDLKIDTLRAFQSRSKRWARAGDQFKPVPEGFGVLPTRRVVPE